MCSLHFSYWLIHSYKSGEKITFQTSPLIYDLCRSIKKRKAEVKL